MKHAQNIRQIGFALLGLWLALAPLAFSASPDPSKWRGFNLMEKVAIDWMNNAPFRESDFKMIRELGFNFVRIPVDYRCYTTSNDWLSFREDILKEIDAAVAYGKKYNLHICLGLHRGPGYCINPPKEATDLWTDEKTFDVFIKHWLMFTKRYKHIPAEELSFNLVNEPSGTPRENVVRVYAKTVAAIHQEDPKRTVVLDGTEGGNTPIVELKNLANVIHSGRGYYAPVTQYKASYRDKSRDLMPVPVWPAKPTVPGNLYGSDKAKDGLQTPLVLKGNFKAGTQVSLAVQIVSRKAAMIAKADGAVVWDKVFEPKDGPGEWQLVVYKKEYDRYQNVYGKEFGFELPAAVKEISIENTDGDWLRFSEIILTSTDGKKSSIPADPTPRVKQQTCVLDDQYRVKTPENFDPEGPLTQLLAPWIALSKDGAKVFIGEFGCYNKTPQDVHLAFTRSLLEKLRAAHLGWAVWSFRGEYGVMDSGRQDTPYEDFQGVKMDRRMMDLLAEYRKN